MTTPTRKTDLEIRQLALDVVEHRVFTDRHGEDALDAFLPIKLGALSNMKPEDLDEWGMVYEYMTQAGSRSCNGRPMFLSFRVLHRDDMPIFFEHYKALTAQREQFLGAAEAAKS